MMKWVPNLSSGEEKKHGQQVQVKQASGQLLAEEGVPHGVRWRFTTGVASNHRNQRDRAYTTALDPPIGPQPLRAPKAAMPAVPLFSRPTASFVSGGTVDGSASGADPILEACART